MHTHTVSNEKSDSRYPAKLHPRSDTGAVTLTPPEKLADSDDAFRSRISYLEQMIASGMEELADLRLQRPRRNGPLDRPTG
jgi:hypothetical protein